MATWIFRDDDTYREAKQLLAQAEYADQMGHADEREACVEALRSLPGYPRHAIGERVEMVLRKPRLFVPRGTSVPSTVPTIVDVRRA